MKQLILIGFLMLTLAAVASGQGPLKGYTNATSLNAPPSPIPQIDATNFVNLGPFNILLPTGAEQFDFSDVLSFTNRSSMTSGSGFIFDTAPSAGGLRRAASVFGNANQGTVSAGSSSNSFNTGVNFYIGLIGLGATLLPELNIYATNIVNAGTLDVGVTGIMNVNGNHLDLSRGTLHVEGFDDFAATGLFSGGVTNPTVIFGPAFFSPVNLGIFNLFQGIGLQTNQLSLANFTLPNPFSPVSLVNTTAGLQSAIEAAPPNATPFVFVTQQNVSNIDYQVVFINTNLPGISTDVRFEPGGQLTTPVVQWAAIVTNSSGLGATNFLYLSDLFGSFQTNFLTTNGFTLSGIPLLAPYNYTFNRSFPNYTNLPTGNAVYDARTIFANGFPATNAYAALEVNVQPVAFEPDSTAAASPLTNLPGRIGIIATNWLDLTRAKITGANYLNLVASNHFVGSANAQIVVPNMDINVGSTNGLLTITNLVATSVPRFTGVIDMWSGRWTNVLTTTVNGTNTFLTNTFHILIVDSGLSATAPVNVLNFAARSTNTLAQTGGNVVISDVLNITNNLLIQSQGLTITTNDLSSPNTTGELNLLNQAFVWSSGLPILQNLTNWGVIKVAGNADFIGVRQPPYFATSFTEPYLSFVNHGLIITEGNSILANALTNTGSGMGVFQFGAVNFTNASFGALLYSAAGPINLQAGVALLTNDTILAADSDVTLVANDLTVINHTFQSAGSLTLSVSNTLVDGGAASGNFWQIGQGINLLVAPTMGDFLGTTVTLTAPAGAEVDDAWAGLDLGASPAGFANNGALGHLILDGGDSLSQFFFGPSDAATNHALYVDQIELRNGATNRATVGTVQNFTAFDLPSDFKIYYADATEDGFDISEKLSEGNNHQLIWVPTFVGVFSATNMVNSVGQTNRFNRAVAQSETIDSNGNGIVNAFDPNPFFTGDNVNLALTVTNSVTNSAMKIASISWMGLAHSTNYLYYSSNLMNATWVKVFSTNQGATNGPIMVKRTNSTGFYRVQVNPPQP